MEKELLLQRLSYIARLHIDDSEKEHYANKLEKFIEWTHKIDEIDTSNVEPMFNVLEWLGHSNTNLRHDVVRCANNENELLQSAPDKEDVFIAVPKIID